MREYTDGECGEIYYFDGERLYFDDGTPVLSEKEVRERREIFRKRHFDRKAKERVAEKKRQWGAMF